jgi:hypothetical protein
MIIKFNGNVFPLKIKALTASERNEVIVELNGAILKL